MYVAWLLIVRENGPIVTFYNEITNQINNYFPNIIPLASLLIEIAVAVLRDVIGTYVV